MEVEFAGQKRSLWLHLACSGNTRKFLGKKNNGMGGMEVNVKQKQNKSPKDRRRGKCLYRERTSRPSEKVGFLTAS